MAASNGGADGAAAGLLQNYVLHTQVLYPPPDPNAAAGSEATAGRTLCGLEILGNFQGEGEDQTYVLQLLVTDFSGRAWAADIDIQELAEYFSSRGVGPWPLAQLYDWLERALVQGKEGGLKEVVDAADGAQGMETISGPRDGARLVVTAKLPLTHNAHPMDVRLPPEGYLEPLQPAEAQSRCARMHAYMLKIKRRTEQLTHVMREQHVTGVQHLQQERAALVARVEDIKLELHAALGLAYKDNKNKVEKMMAERGAVDSDNVLLARARAAVVAEAGALPQSNGRGGGASGGDATNEVAAAAAFVLAAADVMAAQQQQLAQQQLQEQQQRQLRSVGSAPLANGLTHTTSLLPTQGPSQAATGSQRVEPAAGQVAAQQQQLLSQQASQAVAGMVVPNALPGQGPGMQRMDTDAAGAGAEAVDGVEQEAGAVGVGGVGQRIDVTGEERAGKRPRDESVPGASQPLTSQQSGRLGTQAGGLGGYGGLVQLSGSQGIGMGSGSQGGLGGGGSQGVLGGIGSQGGVSGSGSQGPARGGVHRGRARGRSKGGLRGAQQQG